MPGKNTDRSNSFAASTFASGAWRGVGPAGVTPTSRIVFREFTVSKVFRETTVPIVFRQPNKA